MYTRILKGYLVQEYSEEGLILQDFDADTGCSEWLDKNLNKVPENLCKTLNEKYPISEFNFIFGDK